MGGPINSVSSSAWIQKRALAKFFERLLKLFLCVHDDWPIPGHPLPERLTRHQQEPNAVVSGLNYNLITGVEEDKGTVVSFRRRRGV